MQILAHDSMLPRQSASFCSDVIESPSKLWKLSNTLEKWDCATLYKIGDSSVVTLSSGGLLNSDLEAGYGRFFRGWRWLSSDAGFVRVECRRVTRRQALWEHSSLAFLQRRKCGSHYLPR